MGSVFDYYNEEVKGRRVYDFIQFATFQLGGFRDGLLANYGTRSGIFQRRCYFLQGTFPGVCVKRPAVKNAGKGRF